MFGMSPFLSPVPPVLLCTAGSVPLHSALLLFHAFPCPRLCCPAGKGAPTRTQAAPRDGWLAIAPPLPAPVALPAPFSQCLPLLAALCGELPVSSRLMIPHHTTCISYQSLPPKMSPSAYNPSQPPAATSQMAPALERRTMALAAAHSVLPCMSTRTRPNGAAPATGCLPAAALKHM